MSQITVVERIDLSLDELRRIEKRLSLEAHVKRYRFCRSYAHGQVLDCACGIGYGSYLIQQNPDVASIIGVDRSEEAIKYAKGNYQTEKTTFIQSDLDHFDFGRKFDVLISLETIEHLRRPDSLVALAERHQINQVIVCFPTFRTTNVNPYHFHDLTVDDVRSLFSASYRISDVYDYLREVIFVFLDRIF
jgi:2-polyprenyl-3-methyl-5-hydroxy-6-metoxy-1,4-benzoquinol methylase